MKRIIFLVAVLPLFLAGCATEKAEEYGLTQQERTRLENEFRALESERNDIGRQRSYLEMCKRPQIIRDATSGLFTEEKKTEKLKAIDAEMQKLYEDMLAAGQRMAEINAKLSPYYLTPEPYNPLIRC